MDEKRMCEFIAEQFCVSHLEITTDARLVEDLGADSLTLMELVTEMEDVVGRDLRIDELETIRTVGDLLSFVRSAK